MKVTQIQRVRPVQGVATLAGGGGGISGTGASGLFPPSGQIPTASGSNIWSWGSNVAIITSNSSNQLTGPFVNLQSGTGIAFAAASNTLTISSTVSGGGGGSVTFGSNATRVSETSFVGAGSESARTDHRHDGIGTITASSSNTLQRGTFNLRSGTNISFGLTDTDGDGELDTMTIHNTSSAGGNLGWFNVRDYGAKGDDSTNDTTAMQAAINAAIAAGGGIVFMPKGTYKITTRLTLNGIISLVGVGLKSSVIHAVGCDGLYFMPGITSFPESEQYIRMRDFGVVGDYTAGKIGIQLGQTLRPVIERIAVEQFASHGIYLRDMYTGTFRDLLILNNDGDGIFLGPQCIALQFYGGEVRRNNGAGCGIDGDGSPGGVYNITFFGGTYEDNCVGGIDVRQYATNINFFGTYFENNSQSNSTPAGRTAPTRPVVAYDLMLASVATTLRGANIQGCHFVGSFGSGSTGYCILLRTTKQVTMTGNRYDADLTGFYYQDPTTSSTDLVMPTISDDLQTTAMPRRGSSTFNGIAGDYATYSATLSPGGYWRLGEASGTFADSAGTATGTGTAITYGVTGLLSGDSNKAISLNGTTSTIDLGTNSRYSYGDTCSATAWIVRGATGANRAIVCRGTGGFDLMVNSVGYLQLRSALTGIICESTILVPSGTCMVAFTKTGSTVHLYINGADVTGTVTNLTLGNPAENTFIGSETGASAFNNGTIDEVQVYPDVLTPTEIANLYAKGNGASARIITHNIPAGVSGPTYEVVVTPTAPVAGRVYIVKSTSTFTVSSTDTTDTGAFDWAIIADAI